MIQLLRKLTLTCFLFVLAFSLESQIITVNVDKPKYAIQPTMWGIFFEDINFAADGGIYAELVMNRSFEFRKPKMGWAVKVKDKDSSHLLIINRGIENINNPRFARIKVDDESNPVCLINSGFRGMGITKDILYHFSCIAALNTSDALKIRIELVNSKGEKTGEAVINPSGNDWKRYTADIKATQTDPKSKLNIWFEGKGLIDMDMISLFPDNTWKNRPNGLRADLVQLLADMKPGFVRFPGGCIVEGYDLNGRYQWKKTVGDPADRKTIVNRWNTEFNHRPTPDYYQSFGLGFYEYFLLAEDIGAAPLPILNCGMACQFNSAEVAPMDEIDPYVQDALDLIEFANGSAESKWGSVRAKMGHPAPFNMKFLGVGNEQWGPQYFERYLVFEKAIKAKYPEIVLVSGAGPSPDGDLFDFAVKALKDTKADIVDEHYYKPPQWFKDNAGRYDNYDRNSYKIFAGEYAAQSDYTTSPKNRNTWECALSEAAFMTGLERNSDVVVMCSYAPLFAHLEGWQWTPDLIWFDNLKSFGTANYYVQKLFSTNKGTDEIDISQDGKLLEGDDGLFGTAAIDKNKKEIILKLVNTSGKEVSRVISLLTKQKLLEGVETTVLQNDNPEAVNDIENAKVIYPVEGKLSLKGKKLSVILKPYSFSVIRVKIK
ncbi:MAG TPA: alpha-L-arabinofuranosidase C-terminal domain-containing protein [Bacteroidales bacterium]|nr:alpha-L-arabinofuranosidase C-terminal domain-containing protein [Bacteroidales bacterium]